MLAQKDSDPKEKKTPEREELDAALAQLGLKLTCKEFLAPFRTFIKKTTISKISFLKMHTNFLWMYSSDIRLRLVQSCAGRTEVCEDGSLVPMEQQVTKYDLKLFDDFANDIIKPVVLKEIHKAVLESVKKRVEELEKRSFRYCSHNELVKMTETLMETGVEERLAETCLQLCKIYNLVCMVEFYKKGKGITDEAGAKAVEAEIHKTANKIGKLAVDLLISKMTKSNANTLIAYVWWSDLMLTVFMLPWGGVMSVGFFGLRQLLYSELERRGYYHTYVFDKQAPLKDNLAGFLVSTPKEDIIPERTEGCRGELYVYMKSLEETLPIIDEINNTQLPLISNDLCSIIESIPKNEYSSAKYDKLLQVLKSGKADSLVRYAKEWEEFRFTQSEDFPGFEVVTEEDASSFTRCELAKVKSSQIIHSLK